MGLPNLAHTDQEKVKRGNAIYRQTLRTLKSCVAANIVAALENPIASFLWSTVGVRALLDSQLCFAHTLDMCAFGASWRKWTRIAFWNGPSILAHRGPLLCRGRGGLCSFTGKPHVVLAGKARGAFLTSSAQVYPHRLAFALARSLASASDEAQERAVSRMCGIRSRDL